MGVETGVGSSMETEDCWGRGGGGAERGRALEGVWEAAALLTQRSRTEGPQTAGQ